MMTAAERKENRGVGSLDRSTNMTNRMLFGRAFNFELWANPKPEVIDSICARRAHDWLVFGGKDFL